MSGIHLPGSDRDRQLEAAIEQSMRMAPAPPAGPRTNHVLRLELVNLGLRVIQEEHNLIIIPMGGAKLVDRYDAISIALPPDFGAAFAKHWYEEAHPQARGYEGSTADAGSEED